MTMKSRAIIISQCIAKNDQKTSFRFKGAFCGKLIKLIELEISSFRIELNESYVMQVDNIDIIGQIMRAKLKKAKKLEDHHLF